MGFCFAFCWDWWFCFGVTSIAGSFVSRDLVKSDFRTSKICYDSMNTTDWLSFKKEFKMLHDYYTLVGAIEGYITYMLKIYLSWL